MITYNLRPLSLPSSPLKSVMFDADLVKSGKVEKGSSYKPSHLYGFYNILRLCEWEINLQPQVPPILQPIGI